MRLLMFRNMTIHSWKLNVLPKLIKKFDLLDIFNAEEIALFFLILTKQKVNFLV